MSVQPWNDSVPSREQQRARKREAVLLTGATLFSDLGYERTSLDDIASALNITKRTIYYYVDSKEDILNACIEKGIDFIRSGAEKSSDESQPPVDRIRLFIENYCAMMSTEFGACMVLTKESSLSAEHKVKVHDCKCWLDEVLRSAIESGIADGSLRNCDPRMTSAVIFGAMNWIPTWNRRTEPVPDSKIVIGFCDLLLDGLRKQS